MARRFTAAAQRAAAFKEAPSRLAIVRDQLVMAEEGWMLSQRVSPRDTMKGPIELTFLCALEPELAKAIAEGLALHCLSVNANNRRYGIATALKRGFVAFATEKHPNLRLCDIDERFLFAFKEWLDDPAIETHKPSPTYRSAILAALQFSLRELQRCSEWSGFLSPKLKLIEKPYPKAHRELGHKECLKDHELERLYIAASEEISRTTAQQELQWSTLAEQCLTPVRLSDAGLSPAHCAAYLVQNYEHPVPSWYELGRLSSNWPRLVPKSVQQAAERILYPDLDEVLPMLLLVTTFFALNPGTAMFLREGEIEFSTLAGRERLALAAYKPRSRRRQRNAITVTEHPENPGNVLRFLQRRIANLWAANSKIEGRIFCRFSFEARKAVAINTSDKTMREAIGRFCAKHGLEPFRLDQLRPTTLDLVDELMMGDVFAKKAVANHQSAQTTYEYYESHGQKERNKERLGEAQSQLERSIRTGGKADGRGRVRDGNDPGAATPGFHCYDPKDSPIFGEKPGELCGAYGMCAVCELGSVNVKSPRSYAYLLQLKERIDEALQAEETPFGSVAWRARWEPVMQRLVTFYLPRFSDPVVEQARQLPVPFLPPVE